MITNFNIKSFYGFVKQRKIIHLTFAIWAFAVCTIEPNFKDADSIKKAGCQSPEQFLYKSLLAGEIAELAQQISALSGFDADMEEMVEEAKNS